MQDDDSDLSAPAEATPSDAEKAVRDAEEASLKLGQPHSLFDTLRVPSQTEIERMLAILAAVDFAEDDGERPLWLN